MDAPDASPRTATDASPRIAYLGPAGTFTEQATRQWDPDATHEAWPAPSVPAAIGTMVVVSRLTRRTVPAHTNRFMVRLHTPEAVELQR